MALGSNECVLIFKLCIHGQCLWAKLTSTDIAQTQMGPDARRANKRSVLITDVNISGADCKYKISACFES